MAKKKKRSSKSKRRNKKKTWASFLVSVILIGITAGVSYYFLSQKDKNISSENSNNDQNQNTGSSSGIKDFKYVRPPVGAQFITKEGKKIALVSSHFDSPGQSKNEDASDLSGQGAQEVKEANDIGLVLEEFKQYFGTSNIFFMADTNIKLNNQSNAFNQRFLTEKGYKFLFDDSKDYSTSLGSELDKYANPYDKIIYSLNSEEFSNRNSYSDITSLNRVKENQKGFIIDIYKTLKISNDDDANDISNGKWVTYEDNLWVKDNYTQNDKLYNYIKYGISDHVPIGLNISNDSENVRLGFWNVLNFSFVNSDIKPIWPKDKLTSDTDIKNAKRNAHARNIADIVYYANYDLISFVEINKGTKKDSLDYFLKYLNSKNSVAKSNNKKYEGFLTKPTSSNVGSAGQSEQVAFIYNSNLLSLDNDIYPRFINQTTNAILTKANIVEFFTNIKHINIKNR